MAQIPIDLSFYFYARGFTITNYTLAIIELLFNSTDSYARLNADADNSVEARVDMTVDSTKISVQDFAEGMTGRAIRDHFLMLGNSGGGVDTTTSDTTQVRGFFKRGAKDITNIGSLEVRSTPRDGTTTSYLTVSQDLTFVFTEEDVPNTDNLPVGTTVSVNLGDVFTVNTDDGVSENIRKHASMRLVLSDPDNHVTLRVADQPPTRLVYAFPEDKDIVYKVRYEVPNYPGVYADYIIYKKLTTESGTSQDTEYKNIIVDHTRGVVYDSTTFKPYLESHDQVHNFYGVLDCPYITTLLHTWSYDSNDKQNPMLIVDPSRIHGLSVDHPFITELYSIAALKYEILLQKAFLSSLGSTPTSDNILELTENLSEIGTTVVASKDELMYWKSDINGNLLRVASDVDEKYIVDETDSFFQVIDTETHPDQSQTAAQEYITYISNIQKTDEAQLIETGVLTLEPDAEQKYFVMAQSTSKKFEIKLTKFSDRYRSHLLMTSSKILLYVNKNNPYVMYMLGITDPDAEVISSSDTTKRFLMDIMVETLSKLLTEARILANNAFSDSQKEAFSIYNNIYQSVQLEIEQRTFQSIQNQTVTIT